MSDRPVENANAQNQWLYNYRFSILPNFRYRPADKYNCSSFSFHWLVFRVWSMMSPEIGFEVNLDDQNIQIRVRLPYLILGVFLPIFPQSFGQKVWRRGAGSE